MVKVEFETDEKELDKFHEVCELIGVEPDTKLRLLMENEVSTYWENHKRRASKNDKVIEIGVQHMIPPAY